MILEKVEEEAGVMPTIVIIVPKEDTKISMGRGSNCAMRINDISVSRIHSFITYKEGHFRLYDNDSKFGTLVRLKEPYLVKTEKAAV